MVCQVPTCEAIASGPDTSSDNHDARTAKPQTMLDETVHDLKVTRPCVLNDKHDGDDDPVSRLLLRCHRVLDKPKCGNASSPGSLPVGSAAISSE